MENQIIRLNFLLKEKGLHPTQLATNYLYFQSHPEVVSNQMNDVRNQLIQEINRQYRHFNTFLYEVSTVKS